MEPGVTVSETPNDSVLNKLSPSTPPISASAHCMVTPTSQAFGQAGCPVGSALLPMPTFSSSTLSCSLCSEKFPACRGHPSSSTPPTLNPLCSPLRTKIPLDYKLKGRKLYFSPFSSQLGMSSRISTPPWRGGAAPSPTEGQGDIPSIASSGPRCEWVSQRDARPWHAVSMTSQQSLNKYLPSACLGQEVPRSLGLASTKTRLCLRECGLMGVTVIHPVSHSQYSTCRGIILPRRAEIWGLGSHPQDTRKACRALREKQVWSFQKE